jgi:hypothetical protein
MLKLVSGLSMAVGFRHGVLHNTVHGQDHHRHGPSQPRLSRSQGTGHQEQGRPREDQEKDQGVKGSQRQRQKGHGQEREAIAQSRKSCGKKEMRFFV